MKGRGSNHNPDNRFHRQRREALPGHRSADLDSIATEIRLETVRTIISRNQSPDVPFEQSINPYRGCEHGCIYCFARPSHAYWDLSPGLDFETRLIVKENAAAAYRAALTNPRYECRPINLGANTDPYQPIEQRYGLTREILQISLEHGQPLTLLTKSAMITRDLDLLAAMAQDNLVRVFFSVTTLDDSLKRIMEPRAAGGRQRLRAMMSLAAAGVPCGLLMAPVIPRINDHEIETIVQAGMDHGARAAGMVIIRLPREVDVLFEQWLQEHFPDRAAHVLSLIEACHGGKRYDSRWGIRQRGQGEVAGLIQQRFAAAKRRSGYRDDALPGLDTSRFRFRGQQMDLFATSPA